MISGTSCAKPSNQSWVWTICSAANATLTPIIAQLNHRNFSLNPGFDAAHRRSTDPHRQVVPRITEPGAELAHRARFDQPPRMVEGRGRSDQFKTCQARGGRCDHGCDRSGEEDASEQGGVGVREHGSYALVGGAQFGGSDALLVNRCSPPQAGGVDDQVASGDSATAVSVRTFMVRTCALIIVAFVSLAGATKAQACGQQTHTWISMEARGSCLRSGSRRC